MFFYVKYSTIYFMDEKQLSFKKNYFSSDDAGKVGIVSVLAPLILGLVITLICGGIVSNASNGELKLEDCLWFNIIYAFVAPLAFLLIWLFYSRVAKVSYRAVNVKFKIGWKNTLIAIAVGVISIFGLMYFTNTIDYLLQLCHYPIELGLPSGIPFDNFGWVVLYIFLFGLLPAIFEEIIFRGMILRGLRTNTDDVTAVLLSALMFALMHANLQQLIYPFLMGIILGWLAVRTGSTFASMIVHFVNNTFTIIMAYVLKSSENQMMTMKWWEIVLGLVLLAVVVAIVYLIDRFFFKHKNHEEETGELKEDKPKRVKGVKGLSLFVWVAIIVETILLIFSIVWNVT